VDPSLNGEGCGGSSPGYYVSIQALSTQASTTNIVNPNAPLSQSPQTTSYTYTPAT
jgi:hypothetical protein